jgi:hypothetical protein
MKNTAVRWTVNLAASEFGLDRRTVATRLKAAATVPASDGTFSTGQVAAAIYGDLAGEKLRKLRAEANIAVMKDLQLRGSLVPADMAESLWADAIVQVRVSVEQADYIPADSRTRLLKSLQQVVMAPVNPEDGQRSKKKGEEQQ